MKENKRLLDELGVIKGIMLKELNTLIKTNDKQLVDFEGNIKNKERHVKIDVKELCQENENNPFTSSIIDDSIVLSLNII